MAPGSPGFRATSVHTCIGSPTPQGCTMARAVAPCCMWPSPAHQRVGALDDSNLRGSIPSLCLPLSTRPHALTGRRGMTRGHGGSLLLTMWGSFIPCLSPALTGAFDEFSNSTGQALSVCVARQERLLLAEIEQDGGVRGDVKPVPLACVHGVSGGDGLVDL